MRLKAEFFDLFKEGHNAYDEEDRLLSRHRQVEYLTTMKYILERLP